MNNEQQNTVLKILSEKWHHDLTHLDDQTLILLDETQFLRFSVFGNAAVIWANSDLFAWAKAKFSDTKAIRLTDGSNLYLAEKKLREYGMQLAGEHIRFFRQEPRVVSPPEIDLVSLIYCRRDLHSPEKQRFQSRLEL